MKKFLAAGIASLMLLQSCAGATSAIINPTVNNDLPSAYKPLEDSEIDRLYKISMNTLSKYSSITELKAADEIKYYKHLEALERSSFIDYYFNYLQTDLFNDLISYYKDQTTSSSLRYNTPNQFKRMYNKVNSPSFDNNIIFTSMPNIPLLIKDGAVINPGLDDIKINLSYEGFTGFNDYNIETATFNNTLNLDKLDEYLEFNFYFYEKIETVTDKEFILGDYTSPNPYTWVKEGDKWKTDFNPLTDYCFKRTIKYSEFKNKENLFSSDGKTASVSINSLLNENGRYLPKLKNLSSKIGFCLSFTDKIDNFYKPFFDFVEKNNDKDEITLEKDIVLNPDKSLNNMIKSFRSFKTKDGKYVSLIYYDLGIYITKFYEN